MGLPVPGHLPPGHTQGAHRRRPRHRVRLIARYAVTLGMAKPVPRHRRCAGVGPADQQQRANRVEGRPQMFCALSVAAFRAQTHRHADTQTGSPAPTHAAQGRRSGRSDGS
jgi:hypothetical protein